MAGQCIFCVKNVLNDNKTVSKNMTIAILDDGICEKSISTSVYHIDLLKDGEMVPPDSHGTVCAKIIEKYGAVDHLIDIRFLDVHRNGTIDGLIGALSCCLELKVDAINISCGIDNFMHEDPKARKMHRLIRRLKNRGIDIFAAQSNLGRITIPAAFPEVFSVEHKAEIANRIHSIYRTSDIYLRAPHSVKLNGKRVITYRQNSFSCAYASALASRRKLSAAGSAHNRYYVPTLTLKIRIPIVYVERGPVSSEKIGTLNRRLREEGYYVDVISDSIGSGVPGARVFEMKGKDHRLARYIKESMADVVIYLGDRRPGLGMLSTAVFRGKTGCISVLANEGKCDPVALADVSRIAEELTNT